jgi:hypothetical protein
METNRPNETVSQLRAQADVVLRDGTTTIPDAAIAAALRKAATEIERLENYAMDAEACAVQHANTVIQQRSEIEHLHKSLRELIEHPHDSEGRNLAALDRARALLK